MTADLERLEARPGNVLLDLGCGMGRHTFEALKHGVSVVAVDLNRKALTDVTAMAAAMDLEGQIPHGAGFIGIEADALALPFPSGSFDHVIASEILEHIPADERAISEIARVLKPGGSAAVTVPRWWPERICWALSDEYTASAGGHVRIYRANELRGKLRSGGLELVGFHHAHSLHSPYWWLKCAFGVEDEDAVVPGLYHRFLVWQITRRPKPVDALERLLDPVLGKSACFYVNKNGNGARHA